MRIHKVGLIDFAAEKVRLAGFCNLRAKCDSRLIEKDLDLLQVEFNM